MVDHQVVWAKRGKELQAKSKEGDRDGETARDEDFLAST